MLEAEDDEGNVEYKLRLKQPNPVRFQQLVSFSVCRISPDERAKGSWMKLSISHDTSRNDGIDGTSQHAWLMQVTQMQYRLSEGNGECFYYLGNPLLSMQLISGLARQQRLSWHNGMKPSYVCIMSEVMTTAGSALHYQAVDMSTRRRR